VAGLGKKATGATKRAVDKVVGHPYGQMTRGTVGAWQGGKRAGKDIGNAWAASAMGRSSLVDALGVTGEAAGNTALSYLLTRGGKGLGGALATLLPANMLGLFDEGNERPLTNALRMLGLETGITRQEDEIARQEEIDNELATGKIRVAKREPTDMAKALAEAKSFNELQTTVGEKNISTPTWVLPPVQSPQDIQRGRERQVLLSQGLSPELVDGAQNGAFNPGWAGQGQVAQGQATPGRPTLSQAAPGQAAPGQPVPGRQIPGQPAPGQVTPVMGVPNAASVQLPEGYGMATGMGQDGLRRVILVGPQRNADGSPTPRWEDTQRYKDQVAINERMKNWAREMQRERYGRDMEGNVRENYRQAAIQGLERMDREDLLARQGEQFNAQLGLQRAMVDRQSRADAANAEKARFEMLSQQQRDEREAQKVRADEQARQEKSVQDAITQASLSVPEAQREDFIRKAEEYYGNTLRSLPPGNVRARMNELAVDYQRNLKVQANSLTQPSTIPFTIDRVEPYQIKHIFSKNISLPSWLKAVLLGQRVAVGKDGTVVPLEIILDNVFDKDGNLMRGKADELAEVVRLQTPGASR
jgi:hypothetical protein